MEVFWDEPKAKIKIYKLNSDFLTSGKIRKAQLYIDNFEYKNFMNYLKKTGYDRIPGEAFRLTYDGWVNGANLDEVYLKLTAGCLDGHGRVGETLQVGNIVQIEYASEENFEGYGCWYVDRDKWERISFPYYEAEIDWNDLFKHLSEISISDLDKDL